MFHRCTPPAESIRLQLAEKYLSRLTVLASHDTRIVLPADLTNMEAILKSIEFSGLIADPPPS